MQMASTLQGHNLQTRLSCRHQACLVAGRILSTFPSDHVAKKSKSVFAHLLQTLEVIGEIIKMVTTRRGTKTGVDKDAKSASKRKENEPPAVTSPQQRDDTSEDAKGKKRQSLGPADEREEPEPKKQRNSNITPPQSPKEDDTGIASEHPTVSNVVRTESGELVSTSFSPIKEEERCINPKARSRDPGEHIET
jgi:hypothetical protein